MQYNRVGDGAQPRLTLGVLGSQQASPREPATFEGHKASLLSKAMPWEQEGVGCVVYVRLESCTRMLNIGFHDLEMKVGFT